MNEELKTASLNVAIATLESLTAFLQLILAIGTLIYILIGLGLRAIEHFLLSCEQHSPKPISRTQAIALLPEKSSAVRPVIITPYKLMNCTIAELRSIAQYQGFAIPRNIKKEKLLALLQ